MALPVNNHSRNIWWYFMCIGTSWTNRKRPLTGASGAESATPLSRLVWANSFMLPTFLSLAQDLTADSMRLSSMVLLYCSLLCLSALGAVFLPPSLSSLLNFCLRAASFSLRATSLYRLELSFFSLRGVRGVLGCCSSALDCCRNLDVSTTGAGVGLGARLLFSFS